MICGFNKISARFTGPQNTTKISNTTKSQIDTVKGIVGGIVALEEQ